MTKTDRLREVAMKVVPGYPGIQEASDWELFHAIESSHAGLELAIGDLHKLLEHIATTYSLDLIQIWESINA